MTSENNSPATLSQHLILQVLERLTDLSNDIGLVKGQITSVEGKLDRIAPLVDKHETRHNQVEGGMHVGKGIWTVLAGGGLGATIATIAQWFLPHPGQHP